MNFAWNEHPSEEPAPFETQFQEQQQETLRALLAVSVVADRPMVRQTQRRVRQRSFQMTARRQQLRQRFGLAILGFSLVWLMMTPMIWGSYSQTVGFIQTLGWRHCADTECQVMYLTCWLLPITLVTVVIGLLRSRSTKSSRKRDSFVR